MWKPYGNISQEFGEKKKVKLIIYQNSKVSENVEHP
jgi:hypothetical protein